ncbi:TPA: hypothetical protein ACKPW5_003098 [Serratia marcescens]
MDNKLSELSKPVAWTWSAYGMQHATTEEDESAELILDGVDVCPLYSQEYVSALLAELEAKDKRIAELEQDELAMRASSSAVHEAQENHINQQQDIIESLEKKNVDLGRALGAAEAKLATPVRLMGEMLLHDWEHSVERQAAFQHRKIAWDARLEEDKKAIRAAGFTFTVEGDE